ncbi:hypothetical protein [Catelliglobosispora koreensis]|uniref:hypothetical protein n=1 Tax=Catelliglobosispora koreensis TaxID=129052 RepID=UPI00036ED3BD|nr:hypothetical protein [Catelliglobosispora koreensis]
MLWNREQKSLPDLIDDAVEALKRADERAFGKAAQAVFKHAPKASPEELTAGLETLRPVLATVPFGMGVTLAQLAAGLVELGGDPLVAFETLVSRVSEGLELACAFQETWDAEGHGELPDSDDGGKIPFVMQHLTSEESRQRAEAWFTINEWIPSLLLPLQQKVARKAVPHWERLTVAAGTTREVIGSSQWLYGLLQVLDDEKFVVLHRESRRGYELTIGGVGDVFQLHTLLAAHLIGDPAQGWIAGVPPRREWVIAATDGEDLQPGGIEGRFNLVDAYGRWIWNEDLPNDIPRFDGVRVIVLDPPPYVRGWNLGRAYPLMYPAVTVDRHMSDQEAAAWLTKVAPAARWCAAGSVA